MNATAFQGWLTGELERQDVTRRELARRLASEHRDGLTQKTFESSRRAIYKYLNGEISPSEGTRVAIADALGVDPSLVPTDEDEEEDLYVALLLRAMRAKRSRGQLPAQTDKYLLWGLRNGVFSELIEEELAACPR